MVAEMHRLDQLSKEIPPQVLCALMQVFYFEYQYSQVVEVQGVGEVVVYHKLVNTLHDGKERLAMTQHLVMNHFNIVLHIHN